MSNNNPSSPGFAENRRLNLLNFILISLMMACVGYYLSSLATILFEDIRMAGFPIFAFLIAFEALMIREAQNSSSQVLRNPFTAILAELLVILLVIKIYSMLLSGWSSIWPEIVSWQRQFLLNFFDMQFLIIGMLGLTIWSLAWIFYHPLKLLNEEEDLLIQEKMGLTFSNRQKARKELVSTIFVIGGLMIGLLIILRSSLTILPETTQSPKILVLTLLLYFLFSFVFMALNQYAIMKARWYFNDIHVHSDLAGRWMLLSLILVGTAILLVIFLPTDFVIDLYPIAAFITEAFIFLFGLLQFIFFAPIAYLFSLLGSLLGSEPVANRPEPTMPEFNPQPSQVASTLPWWEVVKTILFWLIFLGVILLALRYYLNQRQNLKNFFKNIKLGVWLNKAWQWIKNGFKQAGKAASETWQEGVKKVRQLINKSRIKLPSLSEILKRLPPRQALIILYIDWIKWNQSGGIKRSASQTPLEYAQQVSQILPDYQMQIETLTHIFIQARYTRKDILADHVKTAQDELSLLKKALRQKQEQDQTIS